MALLEKQLFIKKSTIPASGKGLFTKQLIPKNTRILEYTGKITTWKQVLKEEQLHPQLFNRYIFYVTRDHVIDAMNNTKALARYANDAKGLTKIKGLSNNCIYVKDKKRVFMESVKDIPKGGEVLIGYGKEYWDVVKTDIKLALKKQNAKKVNTK